MLSANTHAELVVLRIIHLSRTVTNGLVARATLSAAGAANAPRLLIVPSDSHGTVPIPRR